MAGLHAEETGTGTGTTGGDRLVLLHGFTQTRASWGRLLPRLAERARVVAVDLPGHGDSSAVAADLRGSAAAVAEVGGRATYVGYSMGGRVALRLALDHPDLVERLVLVGATAGIDDADERAARRRTDEERARRVLDEGVDAFLDAWLAQPLLAGLEPADDDLAARRANPAEGLAASLRLAGTGTMDPPWWPELPGLGASGILVTVVVGERDAKFTALGERLVGGIGATATLAVVPGAGHACHLEAPEAFLAAARL